MKLNIRFWNLLVIFAMIASGLALPPQSAAAVSTNIVISQVYGGGGNSGATLKNDFIELYNLGPIAIDVTGWSVQYASATGSTWQVTNLSGTIQPGRYYLIQEAQGTGGTVDLPTPDAIGTIAMSGTNGKVALVDSDVALSGTCPTGGVIDLVGYGTANCFETTATSALSNTTAALRNGNGAIDTDNNSADFTIGTPDPRNSAYVPADPVPYVVSTVPANEATGVALDADLSIVFSEAITGSDFLSLTCADSGTHAVVLNSSDSITFTADPDVNFSEGELCTATLDHTLIADSSEQYMAADYTWSFTTFSTDPAPEVLSTVPTSNATGVSVDATLSVTFSEAVTVADGAVDISCGYSGAHSAVVSSGDNIIYSIDPDVDFTESERCTVTLESTLITDSSDQQLPADYTWSFVTYYDPAAVTPIAVARAFGPGWTGTLQGNVTLLPGLLATKSIAIQDATGGMYVYPASAFTLPALALGDVVQVTGTIKNYNGLLEIDPVTSVTWISTGTVPAPLVVATGSVAPTQGKLIQVQGTLTLPTTPPEPGASHYTFYVNDGSGQLTGYVYKLTNIDMRGFENGQQIRIIGLSQAYNAPQIQPRFQSDLIDLRAPVVVSTVPDADATGVSLYAPVSATFNKAIDADTLTDASFTLTGPSGAVSGTVNYDADTQTAVFTPAAVLEAQKGYTATLTTTVQDIYGVPLAENYIWSFTTGDADTTAPTIVTRLPAPDAVDVTVSAQVVVTFSEALSVSSLDLDHFSLTGPSGVVPADLSYDAATFTVTLTPQASLLYSTEYTVTVDSTTADVAGNPLGADDTWSFTTMAEPEMQVYFGDLHNHTSYSDGSGTPAQALATGKAAGFDFMAISDHSYAISDSEWTDTLAAVETATDEDFVALRGFEYTQGAEGHINVWNSTRHATRTNVDGCTMCDYTPNLESGVTVDGFYEWLVSTSNVGLDPAGTIMQFNHPGWINFNDWKYHPEVSDIARLEEVGNGSGTSYVFSEEEFIRSLDYGWKVGATNNADTHSALWGTNTDHRTGVLMPELTKAALMEALRARRTFASEDKNFNLGMKANGAWMGSEIANTGTIAFDISGLDHDGEVPVLVELITDQGKTLVSTAPTAAIFTWQPQVNVSTGVHYFYVKVTQADGDKIVTSPVWTMGTEDISITDITIQPTIPTIYSSSLLSVRVTNRAAESRVVTVSMEVNSVSLGTPKEVTVAGNSDGIVYFNWSPSVVGAANVVASLGGAPAGDNPDDNTAELILNVTDEHLPLILIDAGHGNLNTAGDEMKAFIDDLSDHQYNVLKNLDELTAADLDPDVVKLLIITAPENAYTETEKTAIGNFVAAGGSLWIGGLADYTGSVSWAATVADRENAILDAVELVIGQDINMRMNDDEVIDANTNNGYVFGVIWQDFPGATATGIGLNVESVATWSMSSIVDGDKQALTAEDEGVQIIMQGDLDEGYGPATWYDPNHTSNENADGLTDGYIYNPTWVYPSTIPPDAVPLPGAAVADLPGDAGRIMLYGDSNDPFTTFAYTAGDGKQNELFNLQSIMWLLGEPLQKSTIAEARVQAAEDQPDNLDKLVWVEGEITAAYGEFFNVLYVQDETGGITVHAPAGDIDATEFTRGTHVRVIGTIGIYNGDTEIEFFEAEMVQVIPPGAYDAVPLALTTAQAALEANEGWLVTVTGTVTAKVGSDTLIVNDGSGPVRIFLDGYNGNFDDIQAFDRVQVTGLASEDGEGQRIRARNYKFHVGIDDDVIVVSKATQLYMPMISR